MTFDEIGELLASRRVEDRLRGVGLASRLTDAEGRELLLRALLDKTNYVAAEAAKALGDCADQDADTAMVERFQWLSENGPKRDAGCHIRANLAFAFGKRECHQSTDALRIGICTVQIEAVGGVPYDVGAHLRANSALSLAQMRARDCLRDIAPLLFDFGENRVGAKPGTPLIRGEVRKAAAQAIGILGNIDGLTVLAVKLMFPGDELLEVLQECMQSVVDLKDERALELLVPYLQTHEDELLAAFAGLMIAQTRTPQAPALLSEALPRFSGDSLEAVVLALTTLRTPEAEAALAKLSIEGSRALQRAIVQVWKPAEKRSTDID